MATPKKNSKLTAKELAEYIDEVKAIGQEKREGFIIIVSDTETHRKYRVKSHRYNRTKAAMHALHALVGGK